MSRHKRKVSFSDFASHARRVVKSIADTCKDLGVIAGIVYMLYEIIIRVATALV